MFRVRLCMAIAGLLALALTTAPAADLSNIDRTIRKEPKYKSKAKYALLVFGSEAKTSVWVVQDGETLYVDRNADGDLTGKDEHFILDFPQHNPQGFGSVKDCKIEIRDPDGRTCYLITAIGNYPESEKSTERHLMAYVDIKGQVSYRQYCDAKLSGQRDKAAIAHFHGPLMIGAATNNWKLKPEMARLHLGDPKCEMSAVVGTMDAERGCWVVVRSEDLPKDLHPVVEIEYSAKKAGDPPIKCRDRLEQRC